jgi:hypothetical protein
MYIETTTVQQTFHDGLIAFTNEWNVYIRREREINLVVGAKFPQRLEPRMSRKLLQFVKGPTEDVPMQTQFHLKTFKGVTKKIANRSGSVPMLS